MDLEFDDYADLNFAKYKDVRIHSIEVFVAEPFIVGLEVTYMVDGEISIHATHYQTKKKIVKKRAHDKQQP